MTDAEMIQALLDTLNQWDLQNRGAYIVAHGYLMDAFSVSERHAFRLVDKLVVNGWIKRIREYDYVLTTTGRNKLDQGVKWNEPTIQPLVRPILRQTMPKTYPKRPQTTAQSVKSIAKGTENFLVWLKEFTNHEVIGALFLMGLLALSAWIGKVMGWW